MGMEQTETTITEPRRDSAFWSQRNCIKQLATIIWILLLVVISQGGTSISMMYIYIA